MALSYLIGSQGNFGHSHLKPSAATIDANVADSPLIMSDFDIDIILELLDNTLHLREKKGLGGYSSASFSVKYVLFALRCLLTHTSNQRAIAQQVSLEMNTLLIKALAYHTMDSTTASMDNESAEYAVFSLYLLSNHCFDTVPFLPNTFKSGNPEYAEDVSVRILSLYQSLPSCRPAGRHAAAQLLLRLRYLNFQDGLVRICISWCYCSLPL